MLSYEEKLYLLKLARATLESTFQEKIFSPSPPTPKELYSHLYEKRGIFVTLLKGGDLRGCMGSLYPEKPLYEEVCEVAFSSAFRDPRFPPLQEEELSELEIEISLLSPLKKVTIEEIEVGKHGLFIKKGFNRGLLLPQVALEYKWDRQTFLKKTCLKAGLQEDCYLDSETEIYVFTAEVFREGDFLEETF